MNNLKLSLQTIFQNTSRVKFSALDSHCNHVCRDWSLNLIPIIGTYRHSVTKAANYMPSAFRTKHND